jgi:hypothetical protein
MIQLSMVLIKTKTDREKHTENGDRLSLDPESDRSSYDDVGDLSWSTDPANPRNWTKSKKWVCVGVVCSLLF